MNGLVWGIKTSILKYADSEITTAEGAQHLGSECSEFFFPDEQHRFSGEAVALAHRTVNHSKRLGANPSTGTVSNSFDNALAKSGNGLYKTELIRQRGPWRALASSSLGKHPPNKFVPHCGGSIARSESVTGFLVSSDYLWCGRSLVADPATADVLAAPMSSPSPPSGIRPRFFTSTWMSDPG